MKPTCDIQYSTIKDSFPLTKVGVTNVKKLVHVRRPESGDENFLSCSFNVYVNLPAEQKGSHLSRNLETLRDIINDHADCVVTGIDDLAVTIGKKLLTKHEYADNANVEITADYFKDTKTPNGRVTTEIYKLIGGSCVKRDGDITKTIGVEVVGMTACPCAQATVSEMLECDVKYPVMSHNQRNVCTLVLGMGEKDNVEANDLIDLVEASFSSPTFEVLKRGDEGSVVINAHKNPKFVEDVVRTVLQNLVKKYPKLPDDTTVTVRSESQESIHKHNAFAERVATMREIRRSPLRPVHLISAVRYVREGHFHRPGFQRRPEIVVPERLLVRKPEPGHDVGSGERILPDCVHKHVHSNFDWVGLMVGLMVGRTDQEGIPDDSEHELDEYAS